MDNQSQYSKNIILLTIRFLLKNFFHISNIQKRGITTLFYICHFEEWLLLVRLNFAPFGIVADVAD